MTWYARIENVEFLKQLRKKVGKLVMHDLGKSAGISGKCLKQFIAVRKLMKIRLKWSSESESGKLKA